MLVYDGGRYQSTHRAILGHMANKERSELEQRKRNHGETGRGGVIWSGHGPEV